MSAAFKRISTSGRRGESWLSDGEGGGPLMTRKVADRRQARWLAGGKKGGWLAASKEEGGLRGNG